MESNCPKERFVGTMIPPKPRSSGHRRAYSETLFRIPDEFIFDSDSNFNFSDIDFPSISDDNISGSSSTATAAIPADSGGTSDPSARHPAARNSGGEVHSRSLSLDTAFFDGLGFQGSGAINGTTPDKKPQHRHTSSMDGVTSPFEDESMTPSLDYLKKSVAGDKLAELALIDPKRAKRILANRQSAARSKERKTRYTNELEQKVQTLQAEATTLSAQLTMLQRDSTGLTIENRELKLRLQSMEQQAHLRDALNEALRDEVQRLKITTSQFPNRGFQLSSSPYFSHPPPLPNHGGHQGHQSHSPQLSNQQHLNSARRPPASPNGQAFNDRNNAQDSMDLM